MTKKNNCDVIQFPLKSPPTISEQIEIYKRIVRECPGCHGPVHPVGREGHLCIDCASWAAVGSLLR